MDRPGLLSGSSYWISLCLSLALYGSLWLPLWLSLAPTATPWHTLALSGSLLLSNFAYTVLNLLSGPLLGSQRRCHADALYPSLVTPNFARDFTFLGVVSFGEEPLEKALFDKIATYVLAMAWLTTPCLSAYCLQMTFFRFYSKVWCFFLFSRFCLSEYCLKSWENRIYEMHIYIDKILFT